MFSKTLKTRIKQPLILISFALLFLFILLLFLYANKKPTSHSKLINKYSYGLPVRLIIPSINVNAKIQFLGVNQTGEMEVPDNIFDAGWFKFGPRPGEKGSAVIAGHLNGKNNEDGIFINLYKLKKGDKLYVKDSKGTSISFVVRESRLFDPGYANDVFSRNDSAHLNLVTCDGVWDGTIKSYTKRLVVFADILTP